MNPLKTVDAAESRPSSCHPRAVFSFLSPPPQIETKGRSSILSFIFITSALLFVFAELYFLGAGITTVGKDHVAMRAFGSGTSSSSESRTSAALVTCAAWSRRNTAPLRLSSSMAAHYDNKTSSLGCSKRQCSSTREDLGSRSAIAACIGPDYAMRAWDAVLARLTDERARVFTIVILGGSEAAGNNCKNELLKDRECAWSARLADWIRAMYPDKEIRLISYASGGLSISNLVASLTFYMNNPADTDLLLVDTIVNDAHTDHALIAPYWEVFLLKLRRLRPSLPVLVVNACPLPHCTRANALIKAVAIAHSVPVVSFFDFVQVVANHEGGLAGDYARWWTKDDWLVRNHPPWPSHQYVADVVAGCMRHHWERHCGDDGEGGEERVHFYDDGTPLITIETSLFDRKILEKLDTCDRPVTQWTAVAPLVAAAATAHSITALQDGQVHTSAEWYKLDDRPGKPAWVSTAIGAVIGFDVTFGAVPTLSLTYLRSYETLADAEMWFASNPTRLLRVRGVYDPATEASLLASHTSTFATVTFLVFRSEMQTELNNFIGIMGFKIEPFATDIVYFRAVAPVQDRKAVKFVIREVATC